MQVVIQLDAQSSSLFMCKSVNQLMMQFLLEFDGFWKVFFFVCFVFVFYVLNIGHTNICWVLYLILGDLDVKK